MNFKSSKIKKEIANNFNIAIKNISVTQDIYSINIKIKDESKLETVEKFARLKYESIDRDQYSGEILQGGNTFVFVNLKR